MVAGHDEIIHKKQEEKAQTKPVVAERIGNKERGLEERGIEITAPIKASTKPPTKKLRPHIKPDTIETQKRRKREAKREIRIAQIKWRMDEIVEEIERSEKYLEDPFGEDFEEQVDYWTSSPSSGGPSLTQAGLSSAARQLKKMREAEKRIKDLINEYGDLMEEVLRIEGDETEQK